MGPRQAIKTITWKPGPEAPAQELLGQGKRPERGQFLLQVDRQTKTSYASYEAAEEAGLAIKKDTPWFKWRCTTRSRASTKLSSF